MDSIWTSSCKIQRRESLDKDIETEAAVIGAGMAGILTAYKLKEKGIETVVLEGDRIAGGQTKKTTAKITSQHGYAYERLITDFGEERAKQYADANRKAIKEYAEIIDENIISCNYEVKPAFLYSTSDAEPLKRETEAAQRLGIPAWFTENVNLPFQVKGAVRFENQAQFNPLKFIDGVQKNLTIYEDTPVKTVKGNIIHTARGTVKAKHIVFATHFPFINVPGYYFLRMHQERSYVLALKNAQQLDGMYISMDDTGYSLRDYGNILLFGGGNHRTGENSAGGKYEELRKAAMQIYPYAQEVAHWSAQDCIPADSAPYIGFYSNNTPNWYVATGFMKWGMSSSMVAADIISDMISGIKNPYAEMFSPQRFETSAMVNIMKETGQAVKGLIIKNVTLAKSVLDELPKGSGGIVESDEGKVGVYKDDGGKIYIVNSQCPHLRCQLEWNPDEKSWDCPCHGSRFDYLGRLIDNPAQNDIE